MPASAKYSSLLRTFVNYGPKKFYNISTWISTETERRKLDLDWIAGLPNRSGLDSSDPVESYEQINKHFYARKFVRFRCKCLDIYGTVIQG